MHNAHDTSNLTLFLYLLLLFQAAKNKVAICQQKIKAQKEKEKKTFANMFDKFAAIDTAKETADRLREGDTLKNIRNISILGFPSLAPPCP